MNMSRDVIKEALSLPAEMRLKLIEKLIDSLNLPTKESIDKLWIEEVERRVAEIESGEVELISGEKVMDNISKRYQK